MGIDQDILSLFLTAQARAEATIKPTKGWFERIGESFVYRFRVETKDLTEFQKYYDGDHYVGCIFNFSEWEKAELKEIVDFEFTNATGFYISPNTTIYPHTDNSPKRSQKTTILNLTGTGSILRLHDLEGNTIFELPEVVRKYTLFPSKVIHSCHVGQNDARLINFWHD